MMPELTAQTQGKQELLIFKEDIGNAFSKAVSLDYDEEGIYLARAAEIVRKEIFSKTYKFSGSFDNQESTPDKLMALISMILEGPM